MTAYREVLARERRLLDGVDDAETLAAWRRRLTAELMTPCSPYVAALARPDEPHTKADFLEHWTELIARMVRRVMRTDGATAPPAASGCPAHETESRRIAVTILAALHGGSTLSRVTRDPRALDAALDLALAAVVTDRAGSGRETRK